MVNLNRIPLVVRAVAVVAWTATPLVAFAQMPQAPPVPQSPAQAIQLQRAQVQQIEAEAQAQIEEVLNPEQKDQYKWARRRGSGLIEGLDLVSNLSQDQQTEINSIVREASRRILDLMPRTPRKKS
jgi:hypothetical protein